MCAPTHCVTQTLSMTAKQYRLATETHPFTATTARCHTCTHDCSPCVKPTRKGAVPRSLSFACRANGEGHHASIDTKVEIPLAGLRVGLMPDATRGKTAWVRKVPLKLEFATAKPPYSETAFVLFADNAAEKEQWYAQLCFCCDIACSSIHVVRKFSWP